MDTENTISNLLADHLGRFQYNSGTVNKGKAYSQDGWKQENWAEFYSLVNNTDGGNSIYGNDCAGFVSMSWRLPSRYTTANFLSDATSSGGYGKFSCLWTQPIIK